MYSSAEVNILEEAFKMTPYITRQKAAELSMKIKVSEKTIRIWFQNKRYKEGLTNKGKQNLNAEKSHTKNGNVDETSITKQGEETAANSELHDMEIQMEKFRMAMYPVMLPENATREIDVQLLV